MVTISARKRLESIESDVIPSMFVGVLSKDDVWLRHTLEETLPKLEERALHLAEECKKGGECRGDDPLCENARISAMFREARRKLETEHSIRESKSRFYH